MISISAVVAYGKFNTQLTSYGSDTRLLELEKLGGLHQVLQLQSALGHVVRLAPLLDTSDIILDLHR